jgi:hypothetical protein
MPCLDDASVVLDDYAPDLVELARAEASIPRQNHGIEPELSLIPFMSNVNVHRFGAIEAVEEEPVRSRNISNARHVEIRTNGLIVARPDPSPANVPNEPRGAATSSHGPSAAVRCSARSAGPNHRWSLFAHLRGLLESMSDLKHASVLAIPAHNLYADRQSTGCKPGGH